MSNPKGLLQSLSCLVLFVTTAAAATGVVFQPALTGFRCEGSNEVTPDGIAIIEADIPVRVTLFGESFTTETIVGFTTEYAPKVDTHNQIVSFNERDKKAESSYRQANRLTSHNQTTSNETRGSPTVYDLLEEENNNNNNNNKQTESQIEARKHQRRLLDAKRHDCTDFDRVISYRLQEDNIITPNVAVLTIRLPELELASGSGMYYYFCVKQPPMMTGPMYDGQVGPSGGGDSSSRTAPAATQRGLNGTSNDQRRELVWVHQGNEWWLMIKVEPPILSIANDCVLIVLLLFLSAVSSGLNLGLMSLDMNELAVISSCGDPRERSYARTIMPLRKRGNYLLCALLLGNVMVNSTLTVILEEMTSGLVAIIGSTLAIVILGEIVPQAFCARRGLAIGAKTIYLTYGFMLITFPLSYPISCLLDCALGEEKGNVYDRERLMEFIRITGNHTQLEADEVAIISGALKLKKIKVDQIMTKIEDVFMLPIDCMLDRKTIKSIIEKGYSRIPVYEFGDRRQIVALILAKDLALLDPDDQMPLASMLMYCKHPLVFIEDTATLDVALNEFKTGKSHMAIVRQIYDDGEVDKYYESIGVVTLEDVIEEVLQTEINDETDTLSDNRRKRRRTDAQVSHLVDELLSDCSSSPGGLAALAPTLSLSSAKPNNNNNNL